MGGEGGGGSGGWKASFSRYWPLKFMPEKFIFHNMTSVSKIFMAHGSPKSTCTFLHSYAASLSIKLVLCETNNLFFSRKYYLWHKSSVIFWKVVKNNNEVRLDSFRNFAYVSSYLNSKSLAWKRDYVIFQKLQRAQTSLSPF